MCQKKLNIKLSIIKLIKIYNYLIKFFLHVQYGTTATLYLRLKRLEEAKKKENDEKFAKEKAKTNSRKLLCKKIVSVCFFFIKSYH